MDVNLLLFFSSLLLILLSQKSRPHVKKRSEFVQEVAGKGLALVYQAAGSESKQGLVDSLVDALSTGRRRAAASGVSTGTATGGGGVDVHGATHAGAALSEAGAGAYGEMCAVSN